MVSAAESSSDRALSPTKPSWCQTALNRGRLAWTVRIAFAVLNGPCLAQAAERIDFPARAIAQPIPTKMPGLWHCAKLQQGGDIHRRAAGIRLASWSERL